MRWLLYILSALVSGIALFGVLLLISREPVPATSAPRLLPASQRADAIEVAKGARTMVLYRKGEEIARYSIRLGFSPVGTKTEQGDGKTPEGIYRIDRRNAQSRFHLSLGLNYPTEAQRSAAKKRGANPGSDIFIHGQPNQIRHLRLPAIPYNWTDGCIAVSNAEIEEIFAHVGIGTKVTIRP